MEVVSERMRGIAMRNEVMDFCYDSFFFPQVPKFEKINPNSKKKIFFQSSTNPSNIEVSSYIIMNLQLPFSFSIGGSIHHP